MTASERPPESEAPIFLIGFMASGKTTVGRLLAALLGWTFHDLDELITTAAGRTVAQIFADEGEAGFRAREAAALRSSAGLSRAVVATGGGAACFEANLALMLGAGRVVTLGVTPADVMQRARVRSGRPLLDGQTDPERAATELLAAREAFYARAHHRVETSGKSPHAVAAEVLRLIEPVS